jgi:uncharacterized membrane protein
MSALAILLATLLLALDEHIPNEALANNWLILHVDRGSVQSMLLGIAGATVGIIGVVFSITLVPLTIASSQFGPVLLRNYLRDVGTQVVLGTYCATTIYALWLFLLLPVNLTSATVPQVSVTCALLLLLVCLGMLVYLFNHIAVSLQASNVVQRIGDELAYAITEMYPVRGKNGDPNSAASAAIGLLVEHEGQTVLSNAAGYIRAVDIDALVGLADAYDLVLLLRQPVGSFLAPGRPLALARCARRIEFTLEDAVNDAFLLGGYRTLVQDVGFGIMSLVVIASRALSPAINDPVTPLMCLDRLGMALGMMAEREQPAPYHYSADGRLRVIAPQRTFAELADLAFNRIRQDGSGSAEVLIYMLSTLATVATYASTDAHYQALSRHMRLVEESAQQGIPNSMDRERVHHHFEMALQKIEPIDAPAVATS